MDLKGINVEGFGIDVRMEEGEERWDLLQTITEFVVKDAQNFLESGSSHEGEDKRNPDFLYSLITLLDHLDDEVLMMFLPRDNGIYKPERCGSFRLESYNNV